MRDLVLARGRHGFLPAEGKRGERRAADEPGERQTGVRAEICAVVEQRGTIQPLWVRLGAVRGGLSVYSRCGFDGIRVRCNAHDYRRQSWSGFVRSRRIVCGGAVRRGDCHCEERAGSRECGFVGRDRERETGAGSSAGNVMVLRREFLQASTFRAGLTERAW